MIKETIIATLLAMLMVAPAWTESKEASRSYKDAKRYLSKCKNNDTIISIGKLGFTEVRCYWETIPELKKVRADFEAADEKLGDVLKQDPEYAEALKNYDRLGQTPQQRNADWNQAKSSVFQRLANDSNYKRARKKRDKALFECNTETFKYILNDYKKQGKVFPIEKFLK